MNAIELLRFIVLLSASSTTAAEMFRHIASRRRNRRVETVRRFLDVCSAGTPRSAVVAVLRELESHGFGTLIVGRRGHESRFIWEKA